MNDLASVMPGLPDELFEHDGLITKRHIRATALAFLRPKPNELLWDVGAGAGSIMVEWCRAAENTRAIGIERRNDRAQRAQHNIDNYAAGKAELLLGDVKELIKGLPAPDAVFIGGGGSKEVVDYCWQKMVVGGRIVLHGVTIETEELCVMFYREYGGSLSRIMVETAQPIGRLLGWTPARAVVQWAQVKK